MTKKQEVEDDEIQMYRITPDAPRMRILIYAEPGVGKTTFAASAQDHEDLQPVLFADVEGVEDAVGHRDDIHAVRIKTTDDLRKLYYALKRGQGDFGAIKTLVIDNITELQAMNMEEIVGRAVNKTGSQREGENDVQIEDYGESTTELYKLLRWFKDLDINLIITAHAKYVYPKVDTRKNPAAALQVEPLAVLPMLTQKLCKQTMGLVGHVWYLQLNPEEGKRYLLTQPDGIIQAKTRGPEFAKLIGTFTEEPTMPKMFNLLLESRGLTRPTPTKKRK